jgi:hypothetical protein
MSRAGIITAPEPVHSDGFCIASTVPLPPSSQNPQQEIELQTVLPILGCREEQTSPLQLHQLHDQCVPESIIAPVAPFLSPDHKQRRYLVCELQLQVLPSLLCRLYSQYLSLEQFASMPLMFSTILIIFDTGSLFLICLLDHQIYQLAAMIVATLFTI